MEYDDPVLQEAFDDGYKDFFDARLFGFSPKNPYMRGVDENHTALFNAWVDGYKKAVWEDNFDQTRSI